MRDQLTGDISYIRNSLIIAAVFMLLIAPHFSWYFCWLTLFLCFIPSVPVFYLTLASFVLYFTWLADGPDRVLLLKSLIFAPFLLLGLIVIWLRKPAKQATA
jgi:hypothetical protein